MIEYIVENYQTMIVGAVTVLSGLAIIAKLTPTPKDDAIIAKILKFLNLIPKK